MERLSNLLKVMKLESAGVETDAKPYNLMDYLRRDHPHLTVGTVISPLRNTDTAVMARVT